MNKKLKRKLSFGNANRETSNWLIITSGRPDASDLYPEIDTDEMPTEVPVKYEIPDSMFHSLFKVHIRDEAGAVVGAQNVVKRVAQKLNMPSRLIEKFYEAFCEVLAEALLGMERISLMGLGTFMATVTHQKRFMSGPKADVLSIRYVRRVVPMFYPSAEFEKMFVQKYGARLVRGWELRNRRTGRYSRNSKYILAIREIPEEELTEDERRQLYAYQYLNPKTNPTGGDNENHQTPDN